MICMTINKQENELITPILLNTLFLAGFVFLRTFYDNFNFIVSTTHFLLISLPISILLIYFFKSFLIKIHDSVKISKKGQRALIIITCILLWFFVSSIIGVINQIFDRSKVETIELGIQEVTFRSTKYGPVYFALVTLPINTGGYGMPDSLTEIVITESENKKFNLGTSKLKIRYRKGLFNSEWIVEKKFIP